MRRWLLFSFNILKNILEMLVLHIIWDTRCLQTSNCSSYRFCTISLPRSAKIKCLSFSYQRDVHIYSTNILPRIFFIITHRINSIHLYDFMTRFIQPVIWFIIIQTPFYRPYFSDNDSISFWAIDCVECKNTKVLFWNCIFLST